MVEGVDAAGVLGPEGDVVDGVRDVEARGLRGDELVDVPPVLHHALTKGDVEVACDLLGRGC